MAEQKVMMRVNCAGQQGQPVSLFAAYDPETDVLVVVRETKYETVVREGFLRVTTRDADPEHDMVFTEENYHDAIVAFFDLQAMSLIQFANGLAKLNPENKIERDGMDERGVKYRIAPDIGNAQAAVLIACFAARRQRMVGLAEEFMDEMGSIYTV